MNSVIVGSVITFDFWGELRTGTVVRIGPRSSLLFVRMDTGRVVFLHPESVREVIRDA